MSVTNPGDPAADCAGRCFGRKPIQLLQLSVFLLERHNVCLLIYIKNVVHERWANHCSRRDTNSGKDAVMRLENAPQLIRQWGLIVSCLSSQSLRVETIQL